MATISLTAGELTGRELLDEPGRDSGAIVDLYVDEDGRPHWLLVDTSALCRFSTLSCENKPTDFDAR